MLNIRRLDYTEPSNILPKAVKGENFAKGTAKCNVLDILLDKGTEILEDHGSLRFPDVVDEGSWIYSSNPFRHKTTLHCAERKAALFGMWIIRHPSL